MQLSCTAFPLTPSQKFTPSTELQGQCGQHWKKDGQGDDQGLSRAPQERRALKRVADLAVPLPGTATPRRVFVCVRRLMHYARPKPKHDKTHVSSRKGEPLPTRATEPPLSQDIAGPPTSKYVVEAFLSPPKERDAPWVKGESSDIGEDLFAFG